MIMYLFILFSKSQMGKQPSKQVSCNGKESGGSGERRGETDLSAFLSREISQVGAASGQLVVQLQRSVLSTEGKSKVTASKARWPETDVFFPAPYEIRCSQNTLICALKYVHFTKVSDTFIFKTKNSMKSFGSQHMQFCIISFIAPFTSNCYPQFNRCLLKFYSTSSLEQ